jgi:3-methylfumaryl-CoA hydratase
VTDRVERTELVQPGPAEGLSGLLGVRPPDLSAGEGLPLLWHWLYCLDRPAQADLGPDGHPVRGSLPEPPGPGRRRMWAGGRVRQVGVLRSGGLATRHSEVASTETKQGRSGQLTFVTVSHRIVQDGRVVVEEEQDVVYREADQSAAGAPDAGETVPPAEDEWTLDVTPALLFRYSALTYNAHRIHYDRDYARHVEGYEGLLTHGPLQAIVMAEAARATGVPADVLGDITYRLVAPLFDHQGLIARAQRDSDGFATAVRDRSGRRTATGTVRYTPARP